MDALAGEGNPRAIDLPSPSLSGDTLDFSFSGLKTATINYINQKRQTGAELSNADIAASFTHAIVSALEQRAETALRRTGMKTLVLAGGVAANSHLRRALSELCRRLGVAFVVSPAELCGDNAAMVAAAGYFAYLDGVRADTSLNASAI